MGTLIGVKLAGGRVLLGSNSDNPYETRTRVVLRKKRGKLRYMGTEIITAVPNVPWAAMITRGVNEAGFAYTYSYVETLDGTFRNKEGKSYKDFSLQIMENAKNVKEAEKYIFDEPRAFHGNFIFADAGGNLALWEITTEKACCFEFEKLCRTSYFVSEEMAGLTKPQSISNTNGKQKLDSCTQSNSYINLLDIPDLVDLLNSHQGREFPEEEENWGHSTCNHGLNVGTVSSEIIDPLNRTFGYNYGWPCGEREAGINKQWQNRSWGEYRFFKLDNLKEGMVTDVKGNVMQP